MQWAVIHIQFRRYVQSFLHFLKLNSDFFSGLLLGVICWSCFNYVGPVLITIVEYLMNENVDQPLVFWKWLFTIILLLVFGFVFASVFHLLLVKCPNFNCP